MLTFTKNSNISPALRFSPSDASRLFSVVPAGFLTLKEAKVLLSETNAQLPESRVVQNTNTIAWNFAVDGVATANVPDNAVTFAKIQDLSADTLLGSVSGGDPEEIDCTAFARSILDDADEATFKETVNLEIGTDVQAWDDNLDDLAALTPTDSNIIVGNGTDWVAESGDTARTSLGLAIGSDVQAHDAELDALAGLTSAANKIPYFTGSETAGLLDLLDEDNMASDSATALATQQSIKAYADTKQPLDSDLTDIAALTTTAAGRSTLTITDPDADRVLAWDDTAGTVSPIALTDITDEGSPATGDYLLLYGAEGDLRRANWSTLPGSSGLPGDPGFDAVLLYDNTTDDQAEWAGYATTVGAINNPAGGLNAPYNLGLAVSAASSALTIALKGADGNDPSSTNPVLIPYRNVTPATGTPSFLSVTAASSLVISSGSTLGVTSSTAFRLWVVGFNDGGTFRLGVMNASTATQIYPLNDWAVASSTAEGGAGGADSAGVIYTGTAVTSKAYRILGFIEWSASGLTAGTWTTTNHLRTQLFGPGVHKPGDVIQAVYSNPTVNFTTNSSTFVTTGGTATITPRSAANLVRIDAAFVATNLAANRVAEYRASRGTTAATNMIGNICQAFGNTSAVLTNTVFVVMDKPNTTSSQDYAFQARSITSDNVNFGNNIGGSVIISEIMG